MTYRFADFEVDADAYEVRRAGVRLRLSRQPMELLLLLRLSLWWAQQFYDESIAVHRQAGEPWGSGIQLVAAAAMRILRGDHEQARRQASEALSLFEELEDPRGMAWSLEVFAGLLAAYGDSDGAACIWAASEQVRQRMGASLPPNIRLIRERYADAVKRTLGVARFETACAEGRAMSLAQAVARARLLADAPHVRERADDE